jgi:hypothetical protein
MTGQAITALILLPFALRAWRGDRHWSGLLMTMAFGFLLIGAMVHARLSVELAAAIAIICAGFFHAVEKLMRGRARLLRTPALVLTALVLTCGPLGLVLLLPPTPIGETCHVHDLADWLNQAHPGVGPSPIVMTDDISYAPELAFRTDYRFVAGPYHRNPQAIFDTIDTLSDVGSDQAKAILDKRQVSLIVRCIDVVLPNIYTPDHFNFYANLGRAKVPDWLTRLTLPQPLSQHFRVYEVNGR